MPIVIHKSQFKPAEPPPPPPGSREAKLANLVIRKPQKGGAPAALGTGDARERYRIDAVIGEGGTGRVVKAFDRMLDMDVAIKILSPRLVKDPEALASLKAEVRITLRLIHKHILRIYNLEKSGENYMVIMEYLPGKTMAQLLCELPSGFALDFVVQIVQVVADALGYAHRHGVLHKDLTPGNIFLTEDGIVKVIDFGIATVAGTKPSAEGDTVVGTPSYMSPEQIRGDVLDARSDIYSFGVLTHQMLTGRVINAPGTSLSDMAFKPHPPISGLPFSITAVLEKATAFNPDERYPSIEEFALALTQAAGFE